MGPSKPPTKAERLWMDRIVEYGCIACRIDGYRRLAAVHHIVDGGRRMGHLFTIPLRELPSGEPRRNEALPLCSFFCEMAEQEYGA